MAVRPTLQTAGRGSNLFDLLRIFAAALVIIGHAWPLSGLKHAPEIGGITIHHLGVYIFFSISGYLLSVSWHRAARPLPFLLRRMLRIFPALILTVCITVFLLGPAISAAPDYWRSDATWRYLLSTLLFAQYELPGVFTGQPTAAVNGSLWSLGPEFCCYLALVLTGLSGRKLRTFLRAVLGVGCATLIFTAQLTGPPKTTAFAVVCFMVGAVLAALPQHRWLPLLPAIPLLLIWLFAPAPLSQIAAWLAIPYTVISIGNRTSVLARVLHRLGDPSYGMYLWGFVLQQLLIWLCGVPPLWVSIIVVLPTALLCGYTSWHLLEKHAIRLGSRLTMRVGAIQRRVTDTP